jgi:hypothetical protein
VTWSPRLNCRVLRPENQLSPIHDHHQHQQYLKKMQSRAASRVARIVPALVSHVESATLHKTVRNHLISNPIDKINSGALESFDQLMPPVFLSRNKILGIVLTFPRNIFATKNIILII